MKTITLELREIKVASFSPTTEDVNFTVRFSDGAEREFSMKMPVTIGERAAIQAMREIRKAESMINPGFNGQDLSSHTSIVIKDEEKATDRMVVFLSKVFEKVKIIKNRKVADGFIRLINEVNEMKIDF